MTNRDIIIDTNAFGDLLGDRQRIGKIIEKCNIIFVARCSWKKEFQPSYRHQVSTMDRINTSMQCLEERNKFKVELPKVRLDKELEERLKEHGADKCDLEICQLAYERARKSRRVVIATNDTHFHASSSKLKSIRIEVIWPEDYDP